MVVTAERGPEPRAETPASVSILTREDIERVPAQDLSELLEFLPGFHALLPRELRRAAADRDVARLLRRRQADYVQLRVDGVPVEDVESGLVDWRRIRAADIERIEALRGPASSLYGDTALGGVIQVFTRPSPPPGGTSLVRLGFRRQLRHGRGGRLRGLRRLGLSGGIGGTYFRTDGYRAHNSEESGILGFSTSGALGSRQVVGRPRSRPDQPRRPRCAPRRPVRGRRPPIRSPLPLRRDRHGPRPPGALLPPARRAGSLPGDALRPDAQRRHPADASRRARDRQPHVPRSAFGRLGGIFEGEKSYRLFDRDGLVRLGTELGHETLDTNYRFVDDSGEKGRSSRARTARATAPRFS